MLAMAEPFLPLLHGCARARVADDRLLKCLGLLLKWPLQGLAKYARRVGKSLLKLLNLGEREQGQRRAGRGGGAKRAGAELPQRGSPRCLYFDPSEALAAGGHALSPQSSGAAGTGAFAVTSELAVAVAAL